MAPPQGLVLALLVLRPRHWDTKVLRESRQDRAEAQRGTKTATDLTFPWAPRGCHEVLATEAQGHSSRPGTGAIMSSDGRTVPRARQKRFRDMGQTRAKEAHLASGGQGNGSLSGHPVHLLHSRRDAGPRHERTHRRRDTGQTAPGTGQAGPSCGA